MASVACADDLLDFRQSAAKEFVPGTIVRVIKHLIGDHEYAVIWLRTVIHDMDSAFNSPHFKVKSPALIVASVSDDNLHDAWILLLFSDGLFGWTNEFEGLKVVSSGKRRKYNEHKRS